MASGAVRQKLGTRFGAGGGGATRSAQNSGKDGKNTADNSSFTENRFASIRPSDADVDGFVKAYASKNGVEATRTAVLKSIMKSDFPAQSLEPKRSWSRQRNEEAGKRTNALLTDHLKIFHEARSISRVAGVGAVPKTKAEFNRSRRQIVAKAHPDAGGTARGFAAAQTRLRSLERRLKDLGIPDN
ncbi:hypothetical protein H6F75_00360 [Nodosilinea sp. FACHB-131]|nr:hypothetical protein [Nodosilinea sp. FACHB-131]